MDSQTQTIPLVERRKAEHVSRPKDYGWMAFLIVITVLMIAGYFISTNKLYKPGSGLGYNLGLAGGLMLLAQFLYRLRKRAGFMKGMGILPSWFKWHMIFGILGPALIMFHSTFYIRSINAGVALICMMLVSGSGIFGRFFYTKIHHGLYGRQASLKGLQAAIDQTGDVKSIFSFAPEIQQRLEQFRARTMGASGEGRPGMWNFITVSPRTKLLSRSLARDLHHIMYTKAHEQHWNDAQMKHLNKLYKEYRKLIQSYLIAVRDVSQFHTYERLFSLWHILHIPFAYMMVSSAIYHVLAVHMY